MKGKQYLFIMIALLITLLSCNYEKNSNKESIAKTKFEINYNKWKKKNISTYQVTLQRTCECMPDYTRPIILDVVGNNIVSAKFLNSDDKLSSSLQGNLLTINDLFKKIENAKKEGAYSIKVQYNNNYGYPASIFIDPHSDIADDEIILNIRNFQPH